MGCLLVGGSGAIFTLETKFKAEAGISIGLYMFVSKGNPTEQQLASLFCVSLGFFLGGGKRTVS